MRGVLLCALFSQVACNMILMDDQTFTTSSFISGTTFMLSDGQDRFHYAVDLGLSGSLVDGCRFGMTPHMVVPSPSIGGLNQHVLVSYTADHYFEVMDAETRSVIACAEVSGIANVSAGLIHTGFWYTNDYIIMVDMTGTVDGVSGGALHKYAWNAPTLTHVASVSMGTSDIKAGRGTTATKPIAGGVLAHNDVAFITDAKGGGSFVNLADMSVVGHIRADETKQCVGGGGLWVYAHPDDDSKMVAIFGKQSEGQSCTLVIDVPTKRLDYIIESPIASNDLHSTSFCHDSAGVLHVINANRISKTIDVIELRNHSSTLATLGGRLKQVYSMRDGCMPDVGDLSADGRTLYVACRSGDNTRSAVAPHLRDPGSSGGVFSVSITSNCTVWYNPTKDVSLYTHNAIKGSDHHGLGRVQTSRGSEIWSIDQAGSQLTSGYKIVEGDDREALSTCGDLKLVYRSNECCGQPSWTPLIAPLQCGGVTDATLPPSPPDDGGMGGDDDGGMGGDDGGGMGGDDGGM